MLCSENSCCNQQSVIFFLNFLWPVSPLSSGGEKQKQNKTKQNNKNFVAVTQLLVEFEPSPIINLLCGLVQKRVYGFIIYE